jgi:hypothetical protein
LGHLLQEENSGTFFTAGKNWDICYRRKKLGHLLQEENIGSFVTGGKHWEVCYKRKTLGHLLQEETLEQYEKVKLRSTSARYYLTK